MTIDDNIECVLSLEKKSYKITTNIAEHVFTLTRKISEELIMQSIFYFQQKKFSPITFDNADYESRKKCYEITIDNAECVLSLT